MVVGGKTGLAGARHRRKHRRMRRAAIVFAGVALLFARVAAACSCVIYLSQAEVDRNGEAAYQKADLIVIATPGDASSEHKAMCSPGRSARVPSDVGRTIDDDRPLAVHRVLKGRAPARPVLKGMTKDVVIGGCRVRLTGCDISHPAGKRTLLVLHRLPDGRYESVSLCSLDVLERSARGRALFGVNR